MQRVPLGNRTLINLLLTVRVTPPWDFVFHLYLPLGALRVFLWELAQAHGSCSDHQVLAIPLDKK